LWRIKFGLEVKELEEDVRIMKTTVLRTTSDNPDFKVC
jgi:hypothetical protein